MDASDFNDIATGVAALIGVIGVLSGGIFGMKKYIEDMKWRRSNLGRELCERHLRNSATHAAQKLLYWKDRNINIEGTEKPIFSSNENLKRAFRFTSQPEDDPDAVIIVELFDEYLDSLLVIHHHVKIGLVESDIVNTYCGYSLEWISGNKGYRNFVVDALQTYITNAGFGEIFELCEACGYEVVRTLGDSRGGEAAP